MEHSHCIGCKQPCPFREPPKKLNPFGIALGIIASLMFLAAIASKIYETFLKNMLD